jgi:hypothetical protein
MDHAQMKERLARVILEKSFKYSDNPPFTLASGRKSNFYFNCKPTTLDPEGMNLIGHLLFNMIQDLDVTAAGGLTLGADPLANALSVISFQRGRPVKSFIVRKETKEHGTRAASKGPSRQAKASSSSTTSSPPAIDPVGHRGGPPGEAHRETGHRPHRPRGGREGKHRQRGQRCQGRIDAYGSHGLLQRQDRVIS